MTIGQFLMYTGANMCSLGYPYGVFKVYPKLYHLLFSYIGIILYILYISYTVLRHTTYHNIRDTLI